MRNKITHKAEIKRTGMRELLILRLYFDELELLGFCFTRATPRNKWRYSTAAVKGGLPYLGGIITVSELLTIGLEFAEKYDYKKFKDEQLQKTYRIYT